MVGKYGAFGGWRGYSSPASDTFRRRAVVAPMMRGPLIVPPKPRDFTRNPETNKREFHASGFGSSAFDLDQERPPRGGSDAGVDPGTGGMRVRSEWRAGMIDSPSGSVLPGAGDREGFHGECTGVGCDDDACGSSTKSGWGGYWF
jgi:hypothetical protein